MTKISGIITFIGCLCACIGSPYGIGFNYSEFLVSEEYRNHYLTYTLFFLVPFVTFGFGVFYTVKTKFGLIQPSMLDNLDKENEVIKRKIEKIELLSKLEAMEKKLTELNTRNDTNA